jgi:tetratricopeptide (TPR) repeat protein/predicted aspartyl protease
LFRKGLACLSGVLVLAVSAWRAEAKCALEYAQLPVIMVNLKPEVDAKVNGQSVRFVLDSGAFYSMITPGTATALKLHSRPAPYGLAMQGFGGSFQVSVVATDHFEVGGTDLRRVEFLTGGGETGASAAGSLGQNILHANDVEYDLANGIVRFVRAKDCEGPMVYWAAPGAAYSSIEVVPFDGNIFATTAYATVNGQRIKVQFDTGTSLSFLTLPAAKRLGFDPMAPGVKAAGLSRGFGRNEYRTWITPIDSFKIGDEEVRHTKLRVADTTFGDVDMLIGADFFLSHHVYVANKRQRIFFTYNGGPVFDLRAAPEPSAGVQTAYATPTTAQAAGPFDAQPTDADAYARRGAAFMSRKDFAHAIEDLTKAHELAPSVPEHLYRRALAYAQNGQPFLAMADLDQALKIAPDHFDALVLRASLRLGGNDPAGAKRDIDAADALPPPSGDQRLDLAELQERAGAYDAAARDYEAWIRFHPDDARLAQAQNGRCWMGAMSGTELDKALAACNAAIQLQPKNAGFLDSRGLVHLRRGETDKAIADYDAALAIQPKLAWSLYGRGLARQRKGMTEAAKADFAAALALDADIARQIKARGVST